MAIKSVSDVAEHQFRSLDEIERYLEELKGKMSDLDSLLKQYQSRFARTASTSALEFKINLKKSGQPMKVKRPGGVILTDRIQKVVIPKLDKLRANFSIVDELYENLDLLKTLESTVSLHFRSKKGSGQILSTIREMKKGAEAKIKGALDFLKKLGEEYEPEPFKELVEKTAVQISDEIDFEKSDQEIYVRENPDSHFEFTHYVRLEGVSDDEGNRFPELFLVFTCELYPQGTKNVHLGYFVNVLHEFAVPGKFDKGTSVDSIKGALLVLGSLLELENFSNQLGTLPLNLDKTKVKKESFSAKNQITSIEVNEREISFKLVKTVKKKSDADDLAHQLYPEVKAMIERTKAKLKMRTHKELGTWVITYTLSNLVGPGQVSVDDVEFLRDKFGVDDEKLRKVVRVINGG